jgi:hypothetical protein
LLEDLRRAQSRGEWPGANTTFCRGRWRGGRVDIDGAREDVVGSGRTVVRGGGINEEEAFRPVMTGMAGLAFGVVGSSAVSDGGVDGASCEASADAVINGQHVLGYEMKSVAKKIKLLYVAHRTRHQRPTQPLRQPLSRPGGRGITFSP